MTSTGIRKWLTQIGWGRVMSLLQVDGKKCILKLSVDGSKIRRNAWNEIILNKKKQNESMEYWLVVSTQLKNISQNGNLLQIKNIWNHHLEKLSTCIPPTDPIVSLLLREKNNAKRLIYRINAMHIVDASEILKQPPGIFFLTLMMGKKVQTVPTGFLAGFQQTINRRVLTIEPTSFLLASTLRRIYSPPATLAGWLFTC